MSVLSGILEGDGISTFELDRFGYSYVIKNEDPTRYPSVMGGVPWRLRLKPGTRIAIVRLPKGSDDFRDGRPLGWFDITKLRKSPVVTVTNASIGAPSFKLKIADDQWQQLLVWLDKLEQDGDLVGATKLADGSRVYLDPRIDSADREADGYCGGGDGDGPLRQSWWIYLRSPYAHERGSRTSIHECDLKTIFDILEGDVEDIGAEEWTSRFR